MLKAAEVQIRKRIHASGEPKHIDQLCLDTIPIPSISNSIKQIIEGCTRLEYLTMNNCELTSLQNFPTLPHLVTLQLNDNRLSEANLQHITRCKQITYLSLVKNSISSFDFLKPLKHLELDILQIQENEVADRGDYRDTIFTLLPSLQAIDCFDREGNFVQYDDDYITVREPSGVDLEYLDQEQDMQNNRDINNAESRKMKTNQNQNHQLKPQNLKRRHTPDSHLPSNRPKDQNSDSQSQMSGEMISNFKKKMQKKQ